MGKLRQVEVGTHSHLQAARALHWAALPALVPPCRGEGSLAKQGWRKEQPGAWDDSAAMWGGEAPTLPNPAFHNVFTRTRAPGAFQDRQPILISPEPARQAQPGRGVAVSPPQPRWLTMGAGLPHRAAAGGCPCPRGTRGTAPGSGACSQGS